MKKIDQNRIVEINIHRSKRNKKLGHAVATLFPCNHHRYLGLTLYKGEPETNKYRSQNCLIIKFDDYEVMEKVHCKLCPQESDFILDISSDNSLDDIVSVLEAVDIEDD